MTCWRIEYNNIGIYEAFKSELWKISKTPQNDWLNLKNSEVFNWLPIPNNKYSNCKSYFKELGYKLFINNTYPTFIKYLNQNKITINKYEFNLKSLKVIYEDDYQIVIEE